MSAGKSAGRAYTRPQLARLGNIRKITFSDPKLSCSTWTLGWGHGQGRGRGPCKDD